MMEPGARGSRLHHGDNAQGVATAPPFRANGILGSYTVTAEIEGLATPTIFELRNEVQVGLPLLR